MLRSFPDDFDVQDEFDAGDAFRNRDVGVLRPETLERQEYYRQAPSQGSLNRSAYYQQEPSSGSLEKPEYYRQDPLPGNRERSEYYRQDPVLNEQERPDYHRQAPLTNSNQPRQSSLPYPGEEDELGPDQRRSSYNSSGYRPPPSGFAPSSPDPVDHRLAYGDAAPPPGNRHSSYGGVKAARHPWPSNRQYEATFPPAGSYGYATNPPADLSSRPAYAYQYGERSDDRSYSNQAQAAPSLPYSGTSASPTAYRPQPAPQYEAPQYRNETQHPLQQYDRDNHGASRGEQAPAPSHYLPVDRRQSGEASAEPPLGRLSTGMNFLSVGGEQQDSARQLPPPSPLLEAYRGTYQSISPMPLAIRPTEDDGDLSDMETLSPSIVSSSFTAVSKERPAVEVEKKKRVQLYDPERDAERMAEALRHSKVKVATIVDVLPGLTHDEVLYLRKEYKKRVKVAGKGVNLPKHIKSKLAGNFGKAVHMVALGRWEGEGYWANFWYQSHRSRRELLIESLMGRTNGEIRNIVEEFRDKRYGDSLKRCMEKELKMDKFRAAILMVLEERRQDENDVYPPEYCARDVAELHRALMAKQGGESATLEIIVRRSDAHLREVLTVYERDFGVNFARAALQKSNNLVGEVIAHILNGVINKPARDAILLRHAIEDMAEKNRDEELRHELLISRLVRLHWDRTHLARVKREYYAKYKTQLEQDIGAATKGEFGEFLVELCRVKLPSGGVV